MSIPKIKKVLKISRYDAVKAEKFDVSNLKIMGCKKCKTYNDEKLVLGLYWLEYW